MPNIYANLINGERRNKSSQGDITTQNNNFYNKEIQIEQSIFSGGSSIFNMRKTEKKYLIDWLNYLEKQQQIIHEIYYLSIYNNFLLNHLFYFLIYLSLKILHERKSLFNIY